MADLQKQDAEMMAKAIKLARKGIYSTTPNPNVGCVIVANDGQIVGQGWHQKAGSAHAEIHALHQAGNKAKDATVYVTLEPCSHHGRTPPCSEALVNAGVKRVVAAMVDPNPLVAGNGLARLSSHGINVSSGLLESAARKLNPGYIKRMQTGMPLVTVKLASSLDGKTALENGTSQWITGPLARQDVQRHRARSCAILSGSGTVLADNPSLNVRHQELGALANEIHADALRQPLRIILDGRNQLSNKLNLFESPGDILLINRETNPLPFPAQLSQWQGPSKGAKLDLNAALKHIGSLGINHIWVEAGAKLAGALLQEKLVDELILYQAPKLIGDKGQSLFAMGSLTEMSQVFKLDWQDVRHVGDDVKLTAKVNYSPLQ